MSDNGTITSNTSVEVDVKGPAFTVGGFNTVYAWDTFDGGTLTVEVSPDGNEWFQISGGTLSAKGFVNIESRFEKMRLTLSGATSPNVQWKVL